MKFLNIVSFNEAKNKILSDKYVIELDVETVSTADSLRRYAAETLVSTRYLPDFNRSTVDGYAVMTSEILGASESIPAMLTLNDEVKMGQVAHEPLKSGMTTYVPTGGMLPDGADGVVMIEFTEKLDEHTLLIQKPLAYGENIIYRGDDAKPGDVLLHRGHRIRGLDMGMLAGIGISHLSAYKPVKVAIFSTGDEIVDCAQTLKRGEIYDINGYALLGAVRELGCDVVLRGIVKDDFAQLHAALREGLSQADVVILSGGSSMGSRDYTQDAIEAFDESEMLFHGISLKPGKPTMIGAVKNKLIIGLPGHPTASALVFQELVRPYLLSAYKCEAKHTALSAVLAENLRAAPGKDNFVPVKLHTENETLVAKPLLGKSGIFSIMSTASGYVHISSEREGLFSGDQISVKLL